MTRPNAVSLETEAVFARTLSGRRVLRHAAQPGGDDLAVYDAMKLGPVVWIIPFLVGCAGALAPAVPAPTAPTAASPESEAESTPAIGLRGPGSEGMEAAVRAAVDRELTHAGFVVNSWTATQGIDMLVTVTTSPVDATAPHRIAFTLSATVDGHEMEDVSGHFVQRGAAVDDVTVREVCQRWKRRYRRHHEASRPAEL